MNVKPGISAGDKSTTAAAVQGLGVDDFLPSDTPNKLVIRQYQAQRRPFSSDPAATVLQLAPGSIALDGDELRPQAAKKRASHMLDLLNPIS